MTNEQIIDLQVQASMVEIFNNPDFWVEPDLMEVEEESE